MMPSFVLVDLPRSRWLPPLPVPLFLLWPSVWFCRGVARMLDREKPAEAHTLRAAMDVFRELRGLTLDVDSAGHQPVRVWFI
jgi:hypothetical protein